MERSARSLPGSAWFSSCGITRDCDCETSGKSWTPRKRRPRIASFARPRKCAAFWETLYDLRLGYETDSALLLRRLDARRGRSLRPAPARVRGLHGGNGAPARAGGGPRRAPPVAAAPAAGRLPRRSDG